MDKIRIYKVSNKLLSCKYMNMHLVLTLEAYACSRLLTFYMFNRIINRFANIMVMA